MSPDGRFREAPVVPGGVAPSHGEGVNNRQECHNYHIITSILLTFYKMSAFIWGGGIGFVLRHHIAYTIYLSCNFLCSPLFQELESGNHEAR